MERSISNEHLVIDTNCFRYQYIHENTSFIQTKGYNFNIKLYRMRYILKHSPKIFIIESVKSGISLKNGLFCLFRFWLDTMVGGMNES